MSDTLEIKSISQLRKLLKCNPPKHPLVTLINYSDIDFSLVANNTKIVIDFYSISLKTISNGAFFYGRKNIDFEEAAMFCASPGQTISVDGINQGWEIDGWGLYFHPDLIRNSFLGKKIDEYSFFSYSEDEALHVSDDENKMLQTVLNTVKREYSLNMDAFSTDLIISNIEVLLNYCKRFYGRQFVTRSSYHNDIVIKFEGILKAYFQNKTSLKAGLPTVKYCANALNLSPNYLSDLLKQETGKSAIEHIHFHLVQLAKDRLTGTDASISEIAYDLGFEQSQNFSRFFKKKTGESPSAYRAHLN